MFGKRVPRAAFTENISNNRIKYNHVQNTTEIFNDLQICRLKPTDVDVACCMIFGKNTSENQSGKIPTGTDKTLESVNGTK